MPTDDLDALRGRTRELCARFPDEYWRETDRNRRYPQEFVDTLTGAGLLAALIPTEYGGLGLGLTEAGVIMEEINKSGGHSAACHAQMYTMGALLRHGSEQQKDAYLPLIAKGELRLQAFSITEPDAGLGHHQHHHHRRPATATTTSSPAHKNWTSRIDESDLALVLARTSDKATDRTRGLTLFLVDLRQVRAEQPDALRGHPGADDVQLRHQPGALPRPAGPGRPRRSARSTTGFRYVIDGWNAERILLASEAIGDGYWFIERATALRQRSGRSSAARSARTRASQFPLADAYMKVRAADLMRYEAARLFDAGKPCGAEANMAKHLASEASWAAANAAWTPTAATASSTHYDIERKFRETRMYQVAPINNNLDQGVRRHQGARPAAVVLIYTNPTPPLSPPPKEARPLLTRTLGGPGVRIPDAAGMRTAPALG